MTGARARDLRGSISVTGARARGQKMPSRRRGSRKSRVFRGFSLFFQSRSGIFSRGRDRDKGCTGFSVVGKTETRVALDF